MRGYVAGLQADFDHSGLGYSHGKPLEPAKARSAAMVAGVGAEPSGMPRTDQVAIDKRPVLERHAHMTAAILDGAERTIEPDDHQPFAADLDGLRTAL